MVGKKRIMKNIMERLELIPLNTFIYLYIPLNKKLKFPLLTIIIRCVFQNVNKLQPQVYLDECVYEL